MGVERLPAAIWRWILLAGLLAIAVIACGDRGETSAPSATTSTGGSGSTVATGGGDAPDPCADNDCHAQATCTPQAEGDAPYTCECKAGWQGDGQDCSDVDECADGADDCHPTELCNNQDGAYECICPTGAEPSSNSEGCERRFTAVTAGMASSCAVAGDKSLWCWGDGTSGELGNGATQDQYLMVQTGQSSQWSGSIAAGMDFACGLKDYGWLWCWGANEDGKLGTGKYHYEDEILPHVIEPTFEWTDLALGDDHACAIRKEGTLWCWGRNHYGQVGDDTVEDKFVPTQIGAATNYKQVAAGYYNACAVRVDGTLWCWGHNGFGQLGVAATASDPTCGSGGTPCQLTPQQVGSESSWQSVHIGGDRLSATPQRDGFVCGLKTDGTLWCWGSNRHGQLGDGSTGASVATTTPTQLGSDADWAQLCTGAKHSCALKAAGSLWCWGSGDSLQSGQADTAPLGAPTAVGSDTDWAALTCGADHTCGLKTNGDLWCWGSDHRGQLGRSTSGIKSSPHALVGDWSQFTGRMLHACGIKTDGSLWCWGHGYYGRLAQSDNYDRQSPVLLGTATDQWQHVTAASDHSCAVKADGSLWCWGQCAAGSCGGAPELDDAPSTNPLYQDWSRVTAGYRNSCGIKTDGKLFCWGQDSDGQVGNGDPTSNVSAPAEIGSGWKDVKTYFKHSCGLKTDDHLWCWGRNDDGQVGTGVAQLDVTSPQEVFAAEQEKKVISFAVGYSHSCAIKQAGSLWCWGRSYYGVLGTSAKQTTPMQLGTDTDWSRVASGNYHVCALKTDNTLWCWGSNVGAQLGAGTTELPSADAPQQVGQRSDWLSISSGGNVSFARKSDGSSYAWGSNGRGQLGLGDAWRTPAPVLLPEEAP